MKKKILNWRIQKVSGCYFCYFDPKYEKITIATLTQSERAVIRDLCDSGDAVETEAEALLQLRFPDVGPYKGPTPF